jgi:putative ABC transport system permease protein
MGARGNRITRQLLTEVSVVCLIASLIAVAFAWLGVRALVMGVPEQVQPPGFTRLSISWNDLAFALAMAVGCGLLSALWPSVRFARPDFTDELREGARSQSSRGRSGGERLRRGLVVLELALAVVLLASGGLLLRSQANIARAPVGISTDHILTLNVQVPSEVDGRRVQSRGYFDRLATELSHVAGVESAGAVAFLPLGGTGWASSMFQVEGRPKLEGTGGTRTQVASPGYFAAFRIPVVRGRALTAADADSANPVALVNETLVRRFLPGENPLGLQLTLANGTRAQIVGVVADVKQQGANADPGQEIITPAAATARRSMTLVLRTTGAPADMAPVAIKAIAAFDPNLAVSRVRTMDAVVNDSLAAARVGEVAMIVFALIALVIATTGLYAIVSYNVAARAREFGIRIAMGATNQSLLSMVARQGIALTVAGLGLGLGGALAMGQLMRFRLFEVAPNDPLTFVVVGLGMLVVAMAAAVIPARRALAGDPIAALKAE